MAENINLRTQNFKESLIKLVNSYNDLPIANIYFILNNLENEIEKLYYVAINEEASKNSEVVTAEEIEKHKN